MTCDDTDLSKTYIVAPKLVIEVISPKSVKRDGIDKLDLSCEILSVDEYLMVDSRRVWASVVRRVPGDAWLTSPIDHSTIGSTCFRSTCVYRSQTCIGDSSHACGRSPGAS